MKLHPSSKESLDLDISNVPPPQTQSSSQREGSTTNHSIIQVFEEFMMGKAFLSPPFHMTFNSLNDTSANELLMLKDDILQQITTQDQINWQTLFTHFQTSTFTLFYNTLVHSNHPIVMSTNASSQNVLIEAVNNEIGMDTELYNDSDVLELFQTMTNQESFMNWAINTGKQNEDDPFSGLLVIRPMSRK